MEIEDYCGNKAESIDLYHFQSVQYSLDRAHFRTVFAIPKSATAYMHGVQRIHMS